jgi:nicotinate-nucleotide--dimethylbenzimidazole phosphoribosyltransferase
MNIREALKEKIDSKTKPLGALGQLETLAQQIGEVQQSLTPRLTKPAILVFAADHGIAAAGVSAYPAEVTVQMVSNFLAGGAAINVFCRQHQIALQVIDAGVNYDFPYHEQLINAKVGYGTANLLDSPAMTSTQLLQCFDKATPLVDALAAKGTNIIGFGEMGIGNTSSASLLMSCLTGIPLEHCVGKGTGLTSTGLAHKLAVLKQVQDFHGNPKGPMEALSLFGGFEIAQICAAMLSAYKNNMLLMVDGFIATVAYLCAQNINPKIASHAIFCHQGDEKGHQLLLKHLGATAIINLALRVGEGTGCALAYPLIQSATLFLEEMAGFESANISQKN